MTDSCPSIRQQRWLNSDYAQQYFAAERRHIRVALRQAVSPHVLQIGRVIENEVVDELDLPFLARSGRQLKESALGAPVDIIADPAFLPIAPNSFATVILPHCLENHRLPHQVLREAHRVLMSEGHLVLTGFNPVSFMGLQRFASKNAVLKGRYYPPKRVIDWLQLLGFEVVASAMYQYAPLSSTPRFRKMLGFLEAVGDRWLPMFGGGYMITAKKRDVGMNSLGPVKYKARKRKLVPSAVPVRTSLKKHSPINGQPNKSK